MESFALYSLAFGNSAARMKKTECEFAISISELWISFSYFFLQWVHHQVFCLTIVQNAKDTNSLASGTAAYEYEKVQSRGEVFPTHKSKNYQDSQLNLPLQMCREFVSMTSPPSYTRIHVHFSSPHALAKPSGLQDHLSRCWQFGWRRWLYTLQHLNIFVYLCVRIFAVRLLLLSRGWKRDSKEWTERKGKYL